MKNPKSSIILRFILPFIILLHQAISSIPPFHDLHRSLQDTNTAFRSGLSRRSFLGKVCAEENSSIFIYSVMMPRSGKARLFFRPNEESITTPNSNPPKIQQPYDAVHSTGLLVEVFPREDGCIELSVDEHRAGNWCWGNATHPDGYNLFTDAKMYTGRGSPHPSLEIRYEDGYGMTFGDLQYTAKLIEKPGDRCLWAPHIENVTMVYANVYSIRNGAEDSCQDDSAGYIPPADKACGELKYELSVGGTNVGSLTGFGFNMLDLTDLNNMRVVKTIDFGTLTAMEGVVKSLKGTFPLKGALQGYFTVNETVIHSYQVECWGVPDSTIVNERPCITLVTDDVQVGQTLRQSGGDAWNDAKKSFGVYDQSISDSIKFNPSDWPYDKKTGFMDLIFNKGVNKQTCTDINTIDVSKDVFEFDNLCPYIDIFTSGEEDFNILEMFEFDTTNWTSKKIENWNKTRKYTEFGYFENVLTVTLAIDWPRNGGIRAEHSRRGLNTDAICWGNYEGRFAIPSTLRGEWNHFCLPDVDVPSNEIGGIRATIEPRQFSHIALNQITPHRKYDVPYVPPTTTTTTIPPGAGAPGSPGSPGGGAASLRCGRGSFVMSSVVLGITGWLLF